MKRILGMALLLLAISFPAFADMTDKATLGGQDSSNNYSWRVDVNHNFIPGTTAQNNIGSSTNQVNTVYAGNFVDAGTTNGGVSQVSSTVALPTSYALVQIPLTKSVGAVYTLANGVPGFVETFTVVGNPSGSDTAVITPTTTTGFVTATLTGAKQSVTLKYINSTSGWIVIGNAGATIG